MTPLVLPATAPLHVGGGLAGPDGVGLAVFFLIGLLGGAHCLGMCGPLVTVYADRLPADDRGPTWFELRQHAGFNAGRTVGYAVAGALMGALGALLFDAGAVVRAAAGVRAVAGIAVGAVIVAMGVGYLRRGRGPAGASLPLFGAAFGRVYALLSDRLDRWATGPGIVVLGTVHALLPCPLLYPAFLYALAVGSPLAGAANLAALGLGTFPSLFAYGALVGSVPTVWRERLHRGLGALFVVLGTVPLSHGLALVGVDVPHPPLPVYQPLALAGMPWPTALPAGLVV